MKEKKHIVVILTLVFVVLILVFFGAGLLRPESYGEHGPYRWNALQGILAQDPVIRNPKSCSACHDAIYRLHEKDAHYNVPCVDCHGAGGLHEQYHGKPGNQDTISAAAARMPTEYNLEGCLYCHRQLKARPRDFPQIDHEQHYAFLHITDPATKCIACHNPHEPIFLLTEARKARVHPIVNRCTDCHDTKPEKDFRSVPNHPTIFECRDCHAAIVKSFEQRPHNKYVECRTCHLFHLENERAGRMYKNGNATFCLLCHEKKPFKDATYPPKVEWPAHLGHVNYLKTADQKICLQCHWNQIHDMKVKNAATPHPPAWGRSHRQYLMNNFQNRLSAAKCGECHQEAFCVSCHKVEIPHNDDFKADHKSTVLSKGRKVCENCHKKADCTVCHDLP